MVTGDYSELSASGVLGREEYHADVDGFFLLSLGSTWGHFDMFPNTLLHLTLSSLVCTSTLHPKVLQMFPFTNVRYYFFVLFVTPKTSLTQLQVCVSLTGHG